MTEDFEQNLKEKTRYNMRQVVEYLRTQKDLAAGQALQKLVDGDPLQAKIYVDYQIKKLGEAGAADKKNLDRFEQFSELLDYKPQKSE